MRKMHCQILGNTCSSSGEYHESEQTHRHELGVFCWEQVFQPMRAGGGAILASDWSSPLRVSALHSRVEALCQTNRRLAEAQCYKTPNLQLCDKCLEIKFWPGGCLSGIKPLNKSLKCWNLGHGLFDLSTLDPTSKLYLIDIQWIFVAIIVWSANPLDLYLIDIFDILYLIDMYLINIFIDM